MSWNIIARSKKDGRELAHGTGKTYPTKTLAEADIENAKRDAFAHFASHPTMAKDDDGHVDDLYDILMNSSRTEFVAVQIQP